MIFVDPVANSKQISGELCQLPTVYRYQHWQLSQLAVNGQLSRIVYKQILEIYNL